MDLLHNMSAIVMLYKCIKFKRNISKDFKVLELTRFCDKQMYEQTGGYMEETNMSPNTDVCVCGGGMYNNDESTIN